MRMIKLTEANSITCSDGVVLNDKSPETQCQKSKNLRKAFPYIKDYVQDDVEEILRFSDQEVLFVCYPIVDGTRDGFNKTMTRIKPLDDTSKYSERVQTFCSIVFDADSKAEFIASLPRVPEIKPQPRFIKEEAEDGEFEEDIPVKERIEGNVLHAATTRTVRYNKVFLKDPKGNPVFEDQPTGNMLIAYKGKYYPSDWDGSL